MNLKSTKIRGLIFENDLTQLKLSSKSRLGIATINKVCNGGSCTYETAEKIARALNVSVEELIEKKGE